MALRTDDRHVHSPQRVARLVMIKFRNGANRPPGIRRVAVLAGDVQVAVRTVRAAGRLRLRPADTDA